VLPLILPAEGGLITAIETNFGGDSNFSHPKLTPTRLRNWSWRPASVFLRTTTAHDGGRHSRKRQCGMAVPPAAAGPAGASAAAARRRAVFNRGTEPGGRSVEGNGRQRGGPLPAHGDTLREAARCGGRARH
jgi:hypothetical protein